MRIDKIPTGVNPPDDLNVIIEVPTGGEPVKYEFDKESGALCVDRFMGTSMFYPANYGFVPQTIAGDGDPVDVLVMTPFPLPPGVVVSCRAIGILLMEDEGGMDGKILAVPTEKILPIYANIKALADVHELQLKQIAHFFEHYKDLEKGKWVKVKGWEGVESAAKELMDGIANYKKA
jgi:inorganic pyrophosphatase